MSALEDLRQIGKYIDSTLLPNANEIAQVVGALLHVHDNPELAKVVKDGVAAGKADAQIVSDVTDVIQPPPEPAPEPQAAADENAALRAEVTQMREQMQSLLSHQATANATTVEHETGPGETEADEVQG